MPRPLGGPLKKMMSRKVSTALDWLRGAAEKMRAFANSGGDGREGQTRPRVGIALAGGFARGIAHLGVLRVLQEAKIPIDCVAGSSVGALIGAGFCAGATIEQMERIALETKFTDFGRWTPSWLGLATNKRLESFLERLTHARTFEELRIPFTIGATDLDAGVAAYYTKGPIGPPLRGSCAYPGLFVPVQYEGKTLVDGFLSAPVPVEGALLLGADLVIAVNLESGIIEHPRTAADVISRAFTIVQHHADLAWRQQADIIIEPDVKPFAWDDFTKTPEMIAAGEAAALEALPLIHERLATFASEPARSSP